MTNTANGKTLLNAVITHSRVGAWHADLEVDAPEAFSGAVALDVEGVAFAGTVTRPSGSFGGRTRARVVGGGGTLSRTLEAKNYASGPKVRAIVEDILGAGERLSDTSDRGILGSVLPKWQRIEGQASHALVALLEKVGATWRVLQDGSIWIGKETWPEVDPPHVLIDEDWYTGVLTVAPESPTLVPGVTFRGHRIEEVVHYVTPSGHRTEAHLTSASSALDRFLGSIKRAIDYTKRYPARVAAVNGDKTVQLVPDDPRIKGAGLDKVRVRSGMPGTITAKKGARCMLGFDNGDPSQPYASDWDDGNVEEMSLAGGTLNAARQGDMVQCGGPLTMAVFGPPGVTSPMVQGTPYPVMWVTLPNPPNPYLSGVISSGNPRVKE